ncbi:hypothetical protein OSB04_023385 [Centaurea solstitialis]|uniref:pyridoxal 5'-phosphate synthase (glutamine hydrolyzing) n=1 Tax=Centaurea solstitialis TaxID=347529 RepID=A0AA38SRL1_9ASTR|nr:hypothetical protein OSB04_023385 [Centaurea solstitialis]
MAIPKSGMAALTKMLRGGVIVQVISPDQAVVAQKAGASAVMVLENFAADIHRYRRMADTQIIKDVKKAVTIPVSAKVRIGHFVEAEVLQHIGVDFIDESGFFFPPRDKKFHIRKHDFETPFICGCENLGEALSRIDEGAVMIRTKGVAGIGDVARAVEQIQSINREIRELSYMDDNELHAFSRTHSAPYELVKKTKELGKLQALQFGARGIETPADAALMMRLGCDGIIVGSGIFKTQDPLASARAIVRATRHYNDLDVVAEVSCGLPKAKIPNDDDVDWSD